MNYFRIFGIVAGIGTSVAGQIAQAMADGVLDGGELVGIIKTGIMGLKMAGVSTEELDQIRIVTTAYEFHQSDFVDGDLVVYVPVKLLSRLKVKV